MNISHLISSGIKYVTDTNYRFLWNASKEKYNNIPDEQYLHMLYKAYMGKEFNIENPTAFSEKLQWLKLYDRRPEYTTMVDKYAVKKYVADIIGPEYIILTLGVWDNFDSIDFSSLPDKFVLKCTHDSGGLVICRDKNRFDKRTAKTKINLSLKRNYFNYGREWPYKNVQPRIIAEKYMEDTSSRELMDYKFYCFDGEPKFLYISHGLENHATASISFINLDWTFAPYERSDYKPFSTLPPKPSRLNEMIEIARKLSCNHCFLRVDLYQINGEIYFSELTFSPCSGFMPLKCEAHDMEIGALLNLPKRS